MTRPLRPCPPCTALTVLAALLLVAGCTGASVADKRASFAPFQTATVTSGLLLSRHLDQRTCVVIRGHWLGHQEIALESCGTAAIVSTGYLLTAGHVVSPEVQAPILVTWGPGVREAAVVWRGAAGEPLQDLALLRLLKAPADAWGLPAGAELPPGAVEVPVDAFQPAFEWAPAAAIRPGAPVFVAGPGELEAIAWLIYSAGEVVSPPEPTDGGAPISVFQHDAPLRLGDSGGPVVDRQGRLLGINVQFDLLSRNGLSLRPDVAWLEALIAADRARSARRAARAAEAPR